MADASTNLEILLTAKDQASKVLKDAGNSASGLGKHLGDVAKIAGGFVVAQGVAQLGGFLMDAAKAAAEDQAATDRLNKSLENYVKRTGDVQQGTQDFSDTLKELSDDMNERIKAGQKLAFSDDDVRDSMQSLLAATDDYGEASKRQAAAMDLARGANIPLATATKLLGKINEENVDVFKRMGIELGKNATEADALAAVQARFGGQAEAYAKSTAGQFEQAKIRMGELKEQLGMQLMPVMTAAMNFLVTTAIPALEKFADYIGPQIQKAITDMRPHAEAIVAFFRDHWPEIQAVAQFVFDYVKTRIEGFIEQAKAIVEIVTSTVALVSAIFHGDWARAWDEFKDIAKATVDLFLATIKAQFGNLPQTLYNLGKEAGNAFLDGLKDAGGSLLKTALNAGTFGLGGRAADLLGVPGFDSGGVVPGRIGSPQLIMAHGGETVLPTHKRGAGVTINIDKVYARDEGEARRAVNDVGFGLRRLGFAS